MGTGADAMIAMDDDPPVQSVSRATTGDAASNTPSRIEVNIATTRAELGDIIGALERKLAPRQLLDSGVVMLKDVIVSEANRLNQRLCGQPLPLALVGLGLAWLLMSPGRHARRPAPSHWGERVGGRAGDAQETVADKTPDIADSTACADARQRSGKAIDKTWLVANDGARTAPSGRVRGPMGHRPLALGVLGLLAGATVALMLPRSAAEERLIGPAGERLRQEAANFGRKAVERAQDIAERTLDAAADAAKQTINGTGSG
jgi:Protein of unknown function (DUF3618)